jgi:hypothetical protein
VSPSVVFMNTKNCFTASCSSGAWQVFART